MNRRKQKIQVKVEMTSLTPEESFPTTEGFSGWLLDSENATDITPSLSSIGDDFFNLLELPIDLDDEALSEENKEIFQDLQFTSTPKSRPAESNTYIDSGLEESCYSKRLKLNASCNTLHDITDKLDSSCNSFVNLSQLSDRHSQDTLNKKPESILRKNVSAIKPSKVSEKNSSKPVSKEELTYYTGIKHYHTALGILKHLKMPKSQYSPFKMQFITLTKLRLNLQWKDMALRFSIPVEDLISLTFMGINVMNFAFNELLPWHVQRKSTLRRAAKCIYGHTLFCESTGIQVLLLLVDSKKPVLFVSSAHPLEKPPLYLLNDCSKHLIPGDVICLCDLQGNRNYYKIASSNTGLSITALEESSFLNCPFVENCQKTVIEILSDFLLILKPETGMDLVKLVKIAGAITNVNSVYELHVSVLGKIFQKSTQFVDNQNS